MTYIKSWTVNYLRFRSHSSSPRKILETSSSPSRGDNVEKKVISVHGSLLQDTVIKHSDVTGYVPAAVPKSNEGGPIKEKAIGRLTRFWYHPSGATSLPPLFPSSIICWSNNQQTQCHPHQLIFRCCLQREHPWPNYERNVTKSNVKKGLNCWE